MWTHRNSVVFSNHKILDENDGDNIERKGWCIAFLIYSDFWLLQNKEYYFVARHTTHKHCTNINFLGRMEQSIQNLFCKNSWQMDVLVVTT